VPFSGWKATKMWVLKGFRRREHYANIGVQSPAMEYVAMFFTFPDDARWNDALQAVEFGAGVGEYEGVVRVRRRVFQRLIDGAVTPERCVEAYHLQRTRFERIAERKVRNLQLTDDGNVEIDGRDLRGSQAGQQH
jgi:hypothetical protein